MDYKSAVRLAKSLDSRSYLHRSVKLDPMYGLYYVHAVLANGPDRGKSKYWHRHPTLGDTIKLPG